MTLYTISDMKEVFAAWKMQEFLKVSLKIPKDNGMHVSNRKHFQGAKIDEKRNDFYAFQSKRKVKQT